LYNAALLTPRANHKAGNILQKYQGNFFLVANHNKTRSLISRITVDYAANLHLAFFAFDCFAVIGYYANRPAINPGIATQNGHAITIFILLKIAVIYQPLDNLERIIRLGTLHGENV